MARKRGLKVAEGRFLNPVLASSTKDTPGPHIAKTYPSSSTSGKIKTLVLCTLGVLIYIGHVARRYADYIEKTIVRGKINSRRPTGRSLKVWCDPLDENLVNVALHLGKDRAKWRNTVEGTLPRRLDSQ